MLSLGEAFLLPRSATTAILTRVFGVNFHHLPTSFFRFVGQDHQESAPRHACYRTGKDACCQSFDIQVLYCDQIESFDEIPRSVQMKPLARSNDLQVMNGNPYSRFSLILRSLHLSAHLPLRPCKFLSRILDGARVLNLFAIAQRRKGLNTKINADLRIGNRQGFSPCHFTDQLNIPTANSANHSNKPASAHFFNRSGEANPASANTREGQLVSLDRERITQSTLATKTIVPIFSLEPGISRRFPILHAAKECGIGLVQAVKRVLLNIAVNRLAFGQLSARTSQLPGLLRKTNTLACVQVVINSLLKRAVIEKAAATESTLTRFKKFRVGANLEFKSLDDCVTTLISHSRDLPLTSCRLVGLEGALPTSFQAALSITHSHLSKIIYSNIYAVGRETYLCARSLHHAAVTGGSFAGPSGLANSEEPNHGK